MTILALYLMATIDSAFCGYRSAAGRNALIDKHRYYRHAMLEGALAGQLAVAFVGLIAVAILAFSSDPSLTGSELAAASRKMIAIYLPYAGVVLGALGLRTAPSVDLRSTLSAIVFGPLTLIRPAIAIAGAAWASISVPRPEVFLLATVTAILMVSMERLLGLRYSRGNKITASSPAAAEEHCRP